MAEKTVIAPPSAQMREREALFHEWTGPIYKWDSALYRLAHQDGVKIAMQFAKVLMLAEGMAEEKATEIYDKVLKLGAME